MKVEKKRWKEKWGTMRDTGRKKYGTNKKRKTERVGEEKTVEKNSRRRIDGRMCRKTGREKEGTERWEKEGTERRENG